MAHSARFGKIVGQIFDGLPSIINLDIQGDQKNWAHRALFGKIVGRIFDGLPTIIFDNILIRKSSYTHK